jgi:hypothetical protein
MPRGRPTRSPRFAVKLYGTPSPLVASYFCQQVCEVCRGAAAHLLHVLRGYIWRNGSAAESGSLGSVQTSRSLPGSRVTDEGNLILAEAY